MNATDPTVTPTAVAGLPATMRAIVQPRYGGPDILTVDEIPVPPIRADEVLLRVEAAGIDRGTEHLLHGKPLLARFEMGMRLPKRRVPGFDVAGTIVQIGAQVEGFAVGDSVCGIALGSFAEYAPALATKLAHRPPSVEANIGGTLAISGLTALQALRDAAKLQAGHRVLVLGASGGVGTFAVQIAASMGAEVTAVCRAAKADLVRSLGAARVLDYATTDPTDGTELYDAIIDIGGRRRLRHLRRALVRGGTAVLVGGEGGGPITGGFPGRMARGAILSLFGGRRLTGFVSKERGSDVAVLVAMVARGELRSQIDRVVGLDGVSGALQDLEAGRVCGKVAVRP